VSQAARRARLLWTGKRTGHPQTGRLDRQFVCLVAQNNTNFVPGGSKKPEKPSTLTPKNQKTGQIDPSNFPKWLRQA
tara:strand:- start:377 stop:607 length:231 start_codon:yes stop_codon:yes gene_type:complete